jgi:hypothetical protein
MLLFRIEPRLGERRVERREGEDLDVKPFRVTVLERVAAIIVTPPLLKLNGLLDDSRVLEGIIRGDTHDHVRPAIHRSPVISFEDVVLTATENPDLETLSERSDRIVVRMNGGRHYYAIQTACRPDPLDDVFEHWLVIYPH